MRSMSSHRLLSNILFPILYILSIVFLIFSFEAKQRNRHTTDIPQAPHTPLETACVAFFFLNLTRSEKVCRRMKKKKKKRNVKTDKFRNHTYALIFKPST